MTALRTIENPHSLMLKKRPFICDIRHIVVDCKWHSEGPRVSEALITNQLPSNHDCLFCANCKHTKKMKVANCGNRS
jgi:hypothetical protein